MIFRETNLPGAFVIEPERFEDERGFFARTWDVNEFAARGLNPRLVQCSISFNRRVGTLRGMHYQAAPHEEAKLVRCTMGAIFDVIVDVRPGSPTFARWTGVELSAANRQLLYIPEGFAHGFQTLQDDSEVFYQISAFYQSDFARGFRWDDEAVGIVWPPAPAGGRIISARDAAFPRLAEMTAASGE